MELPVSVRDLIEQEASVYAIQKLKSASEHLSAVYRGEKPGAGGAVSGQLQAVVYAAARMPATYAAIERALSLACLPEQPCSVLDVGAGTGAGALAAARLYSPDSIRCLEREGAMRTLGQKLLKASAIPVCEKAAWIPFNLTQNEIDTPADLVLEAYMLNELPEKQRGEAVDKLWASASQSLVLVEPGTPDGYRILKQIRGRLLRQGAHVAAPCPHEDACPLQEGDWCHFTARAARTRLHMRLKSAEVPYEDEKFAFLVLTRAQPARAESRVLRHPHIIPGCVTLELCGREGLKTEQITKKNGAAFKAARKSDAGDAFSYKG